ncbi:general transcription factor II-I repeat domain-containing protein 2-like [Lepisosteus oculatus]|uniref:general transcription factor II-I repeat domain-containing protein 2-like n=1 Tax=Lepisosteus oculatus TaxID=7918 RepID=UPI0035F51D70
MESIKGTTKGSDLYEKVSGCIDRMKLPWSKLVNGTTDGSPNRTGKNAGLLKRIQDKVKENYPEGEVIFLHCVIHQEALCKNVLSLDHVMKAVVKLVNFVRLRRLNHRQFIQFLEVIGADHHDLLYNVHWLSLGKVFKRVWELKLEADSFLENMGKAVDFPELRDSDWLCDFTFPVDNFAHLNELNMKLQGKGVFVPELYSNVNTIRAKLTLFSKQMISHLFSHFPTLRTLDVSHAQALRYNKSLTDLHGEFFH